MATKKKIEEGLEPEAQLTAEEKLEALANQTPEERGKEYHADHPKIAYKSVLVASDKAVFFPSLQGKNAALNHSKGLKDSTLLEVFADDTQSRVYIEQKADSEKQ